MEPLKEKLTIQGLENQYNRFKKNCKRPQLQQLFLEVTQRCNLSCIFCGSKCDEHKVVDEVPIEEYKKLLNKVKEDFGTSVFIILTGGEPLLRPDIFELCEYIRDLGFHWGMTSNGTLIDKETAQKLCDAGMYSISISIDGLEEVHEAVRQVKGSYQKSIDAIYSLDACTNRPTNIMVTSVLNHNSINQLNELWEMIKTLPIDDYRVMNVEPIGSARYKSDLAFTDEDFLKLFSFIQEKRTEYYPVSYGCCHYLFEYEGVLRDWFYLCNAGIHVASIMSNGDIGSCLDIERRPETIFGNIYKDDFTEVWETEYQIYRQEIYNKSEKCKNCTDVKYCRGDSIHSWNFDTNEPLICMKDIFR